MKSPKPTPLELAVVLYEVVILLLAAYVFATTPNTTIFDRFSHDLGIEITPRFFAVLSLLCAALSLAVLRARSIDFKRYLYITAATPLILYTLPVGWNALVTRMSGLGIVIYIAFYTSYVLLALATWRTEDAAPDRTAAR